jgi:hypothetical protein
VVRYFYTSPFVSFYVDHWMKHKLLVALGLVTSTLAYADILKTGGNHPTVTIEKQCEGYSVEEAKRSCFSSAIEQVVGQVIVSDLEVSGDRITKDTVARYSAGYVDDYVIKKQQQDDHGWWRLEMSITIASSKIAERKISRAEHSGYVDGVGAIDSIESQLEQRDRGDQLISHVLASYPENAYIINSGKTEFKISNLRQSYVDIPYSIKMSRPWLDALNEALGLVAVDESKCNSLSIAVADSIKKSRTSKSVGRIADNVCGSEPDIRVFHSGFIFASTNSYYFADIGTLHVINNELRTPGQQHIGLRFDLLDAGGNAIDSRCVRIDNRRFIHYDRPPGTYNLNALHTDSRPSILGHNDVYGILQVNIKNTQQMQELAKIKLTVERTCT